MNRQRLARFVVVVVLVAVAASYAYYHDTGIGFLACT